MPATKKKTKTKWGDKDGRRADLLRSARRLLERRGYDAFNLRAVASDAGVTAGTVYTYFASKEELFAVLYAERLDRFGEAIAPRCAGATSPEELFVELVNEYLAVYRVYGRELNVWALLLDGADGARPKLAEPLVLAALRVVAVVQGALDRFAVGAPEERHLALALLWATVTGLCDQFTGARHRLHAASWDVVTRFAARALVRGLIDKED